MAKRRRKAGTRKKPIPGWVLLSVGLVLGLALATVVWMFGWVQPARTSLPKPAVNPQPQEELEEQDETLPKPQLKEPDYSFYDALESDKAGLPQVHEKRTLEPGPRYHYWLQLGAFRKSSDADALKAKLALLGVESSIRVSQRNGQRWHRVRVGPFEGKRARQAMLSKLQRAGFEPLLLQEKLDESE